ncbi:MAG: GrpB family protein [Usitatibacter sp.]
MEAPIEIEPYDDAWPGRFLAERALLAPLLRPWLRGPIEHIGSTAVPGLAAKPVIDIMAGVSDLDASRPALERLREIGYCYAPYRADAMHWLCKPSPRLRTHHLHLVPFESALWLERLAFRDLLAEDPGLARDYATLKYSLAGAHRHDREGYTDAKAPFIEDALRKRLRRGVSR